MSQDGYSTAFDLQMVNAYSIQAAWTGSPTGYLFLQVSNDNPGEDLTPTNWSLIDRSLVNAGGTSGNHLWKQSMAPFRWIRLGFAYGSGSGTLTARLNCKGSD
jgi:hypothetical protein